MLIFKIIINRAIKILGHLSKLLCYPFHYFFPKKRFTIPSYAKPLFSSKKPARVPRIIWQTNYTDQVSLPVYLNFLFNRLMSPRYEYHHVSTEERVEFVKKHASEQTFTAYQKLTDGAAQADLWRLLVLNIRGGVYMDIDAHLVWPLSRLINDEEDELYMLRREGHYNNYFIATAPNSPILDRAIAIIVDNIEQKRVDKGVYHLTGPEVLNTALEGEVVNTLLYRYVCVQGSFTNEHFQYIDKPRGKWTYAENDSLLK